MTESSNFFETVENKEHGWLWNGKAIETLGRTKVQIGDEEFDFNNIQKAISKKPPYEKDLNDADMITIDKLNNFYLYSI